MSERELQKIYGGDYIPPTEDYEELLVEEEKLWSHTHSKIDINCNCISIRRLLGKGVDCYG